jgi:hypothetical protein
MGTTNQIILDKALNQKNYDLIINIDAEKIIPIFNRKIKGKNKENKENKDIYEMTKNEKNIYNAIKDKLKDHDLKYNNTPWINSLHYNLINNNDDVNKKSNYESYEIVDNFIRDEFENYFKKLFTTLSLFLNIIKNNSTVRLLNIQKELLFLQIFLDDKAIKKIFKILIPNNDFMEFLFNCTKVKWFEYWIREHDEGLFYLSEYIISDKILSVFNVDGSIYEGEYKNGKPNGHGSNTSHDNKIIYDGEWENGMRHGMGKLVVTNKYKYSGPFENNCFCGTGGILCDNEGNVYEGDFEKGKFNGYGHYKMCNGDIYIGEFKDGLFHGKGQYNYKNGDLFDGIFKNGKKEGQGMLLKNNGEKLEGIFSNNEFKSII